MASDPPETGPHPPGDLNPRRDPALDFPDRGLFEMSPADYDAIGFLGGLEVHQQLGTRGKLFCRCPSGRRVRAVDAEVLRHMRPTLSEMGVYDGCALMEFKTRKEIVYLLERGTVCTYEMDDTPPFPVDPEAVKIAIEIALLFRLNLVSELHVMRKQYLDGSIPTGFQRTAMVGLDGTIPFRVPDLGVNRELRIRQLSLEEDSCREVSDVGHRITFRTDRLGTPLTEAVTEPDFLTPWELQAGGRLLAGVARSTGKVRRGEGAARQDVNVSVAGGRRVEIKGVPHHRRLPLLVHVEAFRQRNLLRVRHALERRGVTATLLTLPETGLPWTQSKRCVDAAGILRRCVYPPVRAALERGDTVGAVRLPGFAGLLNHRTQPGLTFARELSERVRVIACLTDVPFLIHSDVRDYGLSPSEWRQLRGALEADGGDAVVAVWGPTADVATALREVAARAAEALEGVPAETRQAYADGTTGFERILPGADRMYPDTDTPPIAVRDGVVAEIRSSLPETPWDAEDRLRAKGLDERLARDVVRSRWADLFHAVDPRAGDVARRVAHAFRKRLPYLTRARDAEFPSAERLAPLVRALEDGRIRPEAIEIALDDLVLFDGTPLEEILSSYEATGAEGPEVDALCTDAAAAAAAELDGRPAEVRFRWAMGRVMPPLLGRADPDMVRNALARALDAAGAR